MTDEYGNEGWGRYKVSMTRGDEEKSIEICADSAEEAMTLACKIADDERHVIWDDPDLDLEVETADPIEFDEEESSSYCFGH